MAQLLTWLVNGCYLWEGGLDSANIAYLFSFPFPSSPHPLPLLMVMAVMTEETRKTPRSKKSGDVRGKQGGNGKITKKIRGSRKRVEKKEGCRRFAGSFIKTIIVQDLRIPPGAGVHVEAHIIN